MSAPARGVLHLVVGPSGAGKDAVIAGVLAARPDLVAPRRVVTRPAGPGEDHDPVDAAAFDALEAEGAFALSWAAHGLRYGVPRAAADALASGRHVLVNVSRAAIAEARARFAPIRVLRVDAPLETRARRIAGRGRETEAEAAARLARAVADPVAGPDVWPVDNGGALEAAVAQALAALAGPR